MATCIIDHNSSVSVVEFYNNEGLEVAIRLGSRLKISLPVFQQGDGHVATYFLRSFLFPYLNLVHEFSNVLSAHVHGQTEATGVGEELVALQAFKDFLNIPVPPFQLGLIPFCVTLTVLIDSERRIDVDQIRHHILGLQMTVCGLLLGVSHQHDHLRTNALFRCLLA